MKSFISVLFIICILPHYLWSEIVVTIQNDSDRPVHGFYVDKVVDNRDHSLLGEIDNGPLYKKEDIYLDTDLNQSLGSYFNSNSAYLYPITISVRELKVKLIKQNSHYLITGDIMIDFFKDGSKLYTYYTLIENDTYNDVKIEVSQIIKTLLDLSTEQLIASESSHSNQYTDSDSSQWKPKTQDKSLIILINPVATFVLAYDEAVHYFPLLFEKKLNKRIAVKFGLSYFDIPEDSPSSSGTFYDDSDIGTRFLEYETGLLFYPLTNYLEGLGLGFNYRGQFSWNGEYDSDGFLTVDYHFTFSNNITVGSHGDLSILDEGKAIFRGIYIGYSFN
ncbi:hypothetical protein [Spirochaeta cellobiosiphila]|uniref:hypothetical protein n=1 Tax=Spirochaeta cellobiosiphila TaxID=504483 RepID=UPI0004069594|nr:hypothetical protein [Spirochaeta cellobiosiphila]